MNGVVVNDVRLHTASMHTVTGLAKGLSLIGKY